MAEGIGFGAEGDWKTACLYRTLWVMSQGLPTGCSFLEDYTLNFAGDRSSCLQSHMLEVCPLIAVDKPKLEVHFLGIGIRKQQTARLVFTSKVGRGIKATVVDLGNRFRLISQEVECIEPKPMPNLPVASALWVPQPTFEIGAVLGFWRWYSPQRILLRHHRGVLGRLRRNPRHRVCQDQQEHQYLRLQADTPQQRSVSHA